MSITFLINPPPFLFFTGKGGVGKTSLACATAVRLADSGKRVLLVSTDPASNVGQVFGQKIGHQVTSIEGLPYLSALEVDPMAAAQAYRDRVLNPVRDVMPTDVVQSIEEQLSGSCTTEIAAFDEFTGLLTNDDLRTKYDHIVFDTAPTGHTIRMLELPGAWSGYLRDNPEAAANLGPLVGLEKKRDQYADAVKALCDPSRTRLVLVARAQSSTLKEVAHTQGELRAIGIHHQHLVINGVLPPAIINDDPLAKALHEREERALANMPTSLAALPQDRLPLKSFNMVGVEALRGLFEDVAERTELAIAAAPTGDFPPLANLVDSLSAQGHGLIMTMGKGGVGKTTVAAALAVALAKRGYPVHLTTSDPAAHLSYTLDGGLDKLTVSRIDPKVETERYRKYVLENQGRGMDEQGLAVLEEDLRSPCTEEIAVFQAFSRIIQEAGEKFVVMDTAPTGHTLLLLDATGAYHREMVRQMRAEGEEAVTPMTQLQDPNRTKVIVVTLAETTPVLEAVNLQNDLRRAGIEPWAWVVNNSLAAAHPRSPLLIQRASREIPLIAEVRDKHSKLFALTATQLQEPVGIDRLEKLATH
ncbi:arsenic ABC transporter ATPase [Stutzerimonas stutzeri]|nr:arsenic ABC transporter ATPase [Stutzerimonas stutzeri]